MKFHRIKSWFRRTFCKKRILIEEYGYYRTISGDWAKRPGYFLDKRLVRFSTYKELKDYLDQLHKKKGE